MYLILVVCFLSTQLFAGYAHNTRPNCGWLFWKKYSATARVFTGLPDAMTMYNCGSAYAEKIKSCAWQKTSNGDAGFWQDGGVKRRICSRGEKVNFFDLLMIPNKLIENSDFIERSHISGNPIIFDKLNNKVSVRKLTGSMILSKGEGYYSDFKLIVWKPNDDVQNKVEDTIVDNSEKLHELVIKVNDAGLSVSGDLANENLISKIVLQDNSGQYLVNFDNIDLDIPIDTSINVDDLAVRIEGDGAPYTAESAKKLLEESNMAIDKGTLDVKLFLSENNSLLNIMLSNYMNFSETNIHIFDVHGIKQNIKFDKRGKDGNNELRAEISKLNKGIYYVFLIIDNKKVLLKFMR